MNKKIPSIPAIGIILLCSIVAGAVIVLISLQMKDIVKISSFEKQEKENIEEDTKIDTSSWKIYKSEGWGFIFKYPDFYHIKETRTDGSAVVFGTDLDKYLIKDSTDIKVFKYPLKYYELVIGGNVFYFDMNNKEWVARDGQLKEFVIQKLDVPLEAYIYKKEADDDYCHWNMIIPHPSYSYGIEIENENCLDPNEFLSTFKFINSDFEDELLTEINDYSECVNFRREILGWLYSKTTSLCECDLPNGEVLTKKTENVESLVTKYTDEDFGFSLYYPKNYAISYENPYNPDNKSENTFWITGVGPYDDDTISVSKYSGEKYEEFDAKFGPVAYYYDEENQQWIREIPEVSVRSPHWTNGPADPDFYTVSGLSVFTGTGRWGTKIVALSKDEFLTIRIGGSGWTRILDPLSKTVTRNDQGVIREDLENVLNEVFCSLER